MTQDVRQAPQGMRAWVLNLVAEEELRRPSFRPSKAQRRRLDQWRPRLASLVGPGTILGEAEPTPSLAGRQGMAWCPTPSALAALAAAGAEVPRAPPLHVLRRVNHRRFCAELGHGLEGAAFCSTRHEVDVRLATPTSSGHWLLKRPLSAFGAGRRRIRVGEADEDASRWIEASLRGHGGLQVEPWVAVELDVALHGFVGFDGAVTLGRPVENRCDAHGAWIAALLDPPLRDEERRALRLEGERAGAALASAGYFGPFGIDGYRHRDGFVPRGELNARYSMGWAIGMPDRPDLAPVAGC